MKHELFAVISALCVVAICPAVGRGESYNWTGMANDGQWGNPANWVGGAGVPAGVEGVAIFDSKPASEHVVTLGGGLTIDQLIVRNDDVALDLKGVWLELRGAFKMGDAFNQNARVRIRNGVLRQGIGKLRLGERERNTAELIVSGAGSGIIKSGSTDIGYAGTAVCGLQVLDGAIFDNTLMVIGVKGAGEALVSNATLVASGLRLGDDSEEASGSLILSGPQTRWNKALGAGPNVFVGRLGRGSLRVEDGAVVHSGAYFIMAGQGGSATGEVTVAGSGSRIDNFGAITLGGSGRGTLAEPPSRGGVGVLSALDGGALQGNGNSENYYFYIGEGSRLYIRDGSISYDRSGANRKHPFLLSPGSVLSFELTPRSAAFSAATPFIWSGATQSGAGGVNLIEGAVLDVGLADGFEPEVGDVFTLFRYSGELEGCFDGLPDGGVLERGTTSFRISYGSRRNSAITIRVIRGTGAVMYIRSERKHDMRLVEGSGAWSVIDGDFSFEIDKETGALGSVVLAGKEIAGPHGAPPIQSSLVDSAGWDGLASVADYTVVPGEFVVGSISPRLTFEGFEARVDGVVQYGGGDSLEATLFWLAKAGGRHIRAVVSFAPRGEFQNRFLRELSLRLPLNLDFRKRVIQAGDRGLWWDTRHYYQFHNAGATVYLEYPESNWWRHFHVDQHSPEAYRIWRAESADTAGLEAYNGQLAAGWMALYDQTGGMLFALRDMARLAPADLYADAAFGGEAVVHLQGPVHQPRSFDDPSTVAALFTEPRVADFIFHRGVAPAARPDRDLAEAWGVESLRSDGLGIPASAADDSGLWRVDELTGDFSPMVAGGVPLPRGSSFAHGKARLFVAGAEVPLQTETLAYWPDGSVKWVQLVFPLEPPADQPAGHGAGDEVSFAITRRVGEPIPAVLRYGNQISSAAPPRVLSVAESGGAVVIDSGKLSLELGSGKRWLRSVKLNGAEKLRYDEKAQAVVDFLRPAELYEAGSALARGADDPGDVMISSVEVEEDGPLRAVVRLEGWAQAQEPARVILRVEAYADRPWVRLFHSVEFMQKDPRVVFLRRMAVRLPLAASGEIFAGLGRGRDGLEPAGMTGLRQVTPGRVELWRKPPSGGAYREVLERANFSSGWFMAGDVGVAMRDMWQESPKEILYRADENALEAHLWPESAPIMDVRRYSNYPHRSQGESVNVNPFWVTQKYYPEDPFVGVSKTHELLLLFGDGSESYDVDSAVADFQSRPLAYAGWDHYAATQVTMPLAPMGDASFDPFNTNMHNAAKWWLFHQRAWGWYGMWDYGDVRHLYNSGYGWVYPPGDLRAILKMPPAERVAANLTGFTAPRDYFPQNGWAFDNGRWGWGNTEGLPNHFISLEYLRTGDRDLFFFIEANARHVRDVDARHAGKWYGKGTRHGVQHWSDGNHERRQTTFAEQRVHYLLTGEHRTREWLKKLSVEVYLKGSESVHAAHSGRAYGLLFWWEVSGDAAVGQTLKNYMYAFARPEGVDISPVVSFPSGASGGSAVALHDANMFFHTFGGMHALIEYYYLTKDARVRQAILATAAHVMSLGGITASGQGYHRMTIGFAARHAPQPQIYQAALRDWALGAGESFVYRQVPGNTEQWCGTPDFYHSNIAGGLFWNNHGYYALGALGELPALSQARVAKMQADDSRQPAPRSRSPRESWQSEYDLPEFDLHLQEYLNPGLKPPWP